MIQWTSLPKFDMITAMSNFNNLQFEYCNDKIHYNTYYCEWEGWFQEGIVNRESYGFSALKFGIGR